MRDDDDDIVKVGVGATLAPVLVSITHHPSTQT